MLRSSGREKELSGGEPQTTNNRMELTAAIKALEALKRPCAVDLYTDSQYVRHGITEWIQGWKAHGWKTADRKPVKNDDLWRALDAARSRHEVTWHWVRGHADDPLNHRVDALAVAAMAPFRKRARREAGLSAATSANTSPGGRGRVRGADRVRGAPAGRKGSAGSAAEAVTPHPDGACAPSRPLPPGEVARANPSAPSRTPGMSPKA